LTRSHAQAAFYLLPTRAWELGIGAILAIGAPHIRSRSLREILAVGGLAGILYGVFYFSENIPFPGWRAAIPTIGTDAILSAVLAGAGVNRVLSTAPFTFIGKISYSVYLWHWPVILAFSYGAIRPSTIFTSLLCIAVSFALAVLSWRYVELPFRTRRVLPDAKSLFRGAALASVTAIGVGALLYLSNGLPQRHSPELAALLAQDDLKSGQPNCDGVTAKRAAADRLCIRGAPGVAPSFVLAGDSHANALADGLFAAARSRGVAGVHFTAPGFVPLPGRRSLGGRRRDILVPEFLSYLKRHPELRTIIVTGFWAHEASGRSYKDKPRIDVDEGYDGSGAAYTPIAFRHSLERLVGAFPNRRFILLDDIPTGKELSLREYARIMYVNGSAPPAGLPRRIADAQRASYDPLLRAVTSAHPNVSYVPVFAWVCDRRICPLFQRNGLLLYRDGDHLSRTASEKLAPFLRGLFEPRAATMSAKMI
jgi:hypothetical protein